MNFVGKMLHTPNTLNLALVYTQMVVQPKVKEMTKAILMLQMNIKIVKIIMKLKLMRVLIKIKINI